MQQTEVAEPEVEAFSDREMYSLYQRPDRVLDLVVAQWRRFSATVEAGRHLGLLSAAMLATSVIGAAVYGLVLGIDAAWRVAILYVGSLAVCFPSLHVFGAYVGRRVSVAQNLTLALVMSTVAGVFALAFAPILLFIALTNHSAAQIGTAELSVLFLGAAFFAGLGHLNRCAWRAVHTSAPGLVVVAWQVLLAFVTLRMGAALGLA